MLPCIIKIIADEDGNGNMGKERSVCRRQTLLLTRETNMKEYRH